MKVSRFFNLLFFKAMWLGMFGFLLWKLAPSARTLNPIRLAAGMSTSAELMQIETALERYKMLNEQYPDDFSRFLEDSFQSRHKKVSQDSWGTPYQFFLNKDGYTVRSAGPDKLFDTSDDYSIFHKTGEGQIGWLDERFIIV